MYKYRIPYSLIQIVIRLFEGHPLVFPLPGGNKNGGNFNAPSFGGGWGRSCVNDYPLVFPNAKAVLRPSRGKCNAWKFLCPLLWRGLGEVIRKRTVLLENKTGSLMESLLTASVCFYSNLSCTLFPLSFFQGSLL